MATPNEAAFVLAKRLLELRTSHWPGVSVKQEQLKVAFGVSVPLISSWENSKKPAAPPEDRLNNYAIFFATERSLQGQRPRLLNLTELTEAERHTYEQLASELKLLRMAITSGTATPAMSDTAPVGQGFWRFPDNNPITIVCGRLPDDFTGDRAYTDPDSPDYVALYTFADLDAMIELHGHIRAANPDAHVTFAPAKGKKMVTRDQLMNHLVVLGGVDFNPINQEVLEQLRVPVVQQDRDEDPVGAFEITDSEERRVLAPQLRETGAGRFLTEDIGHFLRGPNPFNRKRTVTICNGQFARGVYGAARALSDIKFRDRNAGYIRSRFKQTDTFSVLFRVTVIRGEVITPDWTLAGIVLHEWSGFMDEPQAR